MLKIVDLKFSKTNIHNYVSHTMFTTYRFNYISPKLVRRISEKNLCQRFCIMPNLQQAFDKLATFSSS